MQGPWAQILPVGRADCQPDILRARWAAYARRREVAPSWRVGEVSPLCSWWPARGPLASGPGMTDHFQSGHRSGDRGTGRAPGLLSKVSPLNS